MWRTIVEPKNNTAAPAFEDADAAGAQNAIAHVLLFSVRLSVHLASIVTTLRLFHSRALRSG